MLKKRTGLAPKRYRRRGQGGGTDNSFENRISRHFLFNALNAVITLCRKNPGEAAALAGDIGAYVQRSLEDKAPLIALEEELEHVLAYVNIQKARFFPRLRVALAIEEDLHCLMPAFTLQPLVDNAVRHGVLKRRRGGTVTIAVGKSAGAVVFSVADDGVGMSAAEIDGLFAGQNLRHSMGRVNQNLKKAGFGGLRISSAPGAGTKVTFAIPPAP
jgi:LytS/YehU family sensor histidine kinase